MKYSWFIREVLSAYKAHVTHSAKHLSQEHTGSCFYKNKFHNGFITNFIDFYNPLHSSMTNREMSDDDISDLTFYKYLFYI